MKKLFALILVALMVVSMAACTAQPAPAAAEKPAAEAPAEQAAPAAAAEAAPAEAKEDDFLLGLSFGDLRLERWQKDLGYIREKCDEYGIKYVYASADDDEQAQLTQIESMLTQGADVIICLPVNTDSLGPAVTLCHDNDCALISYDRLVMNGDLDYYITFDPYSVGKKQAEYLVNLVPEGNYFLLEGDMTDNNGRLFYQGHMEVLQPLIDSGKIKAVAEQWCQGWLESNALALTEQVLTANNNDIAAICCANDSMAAGAVAALDEQGLLGKVLVTGQDADLAACKSIVAGKQSMTIYKPISTLAYGAVDLAKAIRDGETVNTTTTFNNGFKDVPSIAFEVSAVTKDNMMDTIIKDGFHSYDDVYADIPENERPAK